MSTRTMEPSLQLTAQDFSTIVEILHEVTGIRLTDTKHELVRARLRKRVLATGAKDLGGYVSLLRAHPERELSHMVEALTTNETSFFREAAHFEILCDAVLAPAKDPVRIWCAASSTGEEPYSIAISAMARPPGAGLRSVRILATDIDTQVLAVARRGVYSEEAVSRVPRALRERCMSTTQQDGKLSYQISDAVRDRVAFARLNLMTTPWALRGELDAVFLRNVMIYFDPPTRAWLATRMARMLRPGGYLFIGHSETLGLSPSGLQPVRPSVYVRTGAEVRDPGERPL